MPARTLSVACSVLLGIAIGVATMFLWFAVDFLRYFPVGEDSPTAIGFPLGLVIGILIWLRLRELVALLIVLVTVGLIGSVTSCMKFIELGRLSTETDGWAGLAYTLAYGVWLIIFSGFVCMLLSGILSVIRKRLMNKKFAESGRR